jgi:hypothetical protein
MPDIRKNPGVVTQITTVKLNPTTRTKFWR